MITQEKLKELFSYDENTGELIWKKTKFKRLVGKPAGNISKVSGYKRVNIADFGCLYNHRLVWLWHYGELNDAQELDHINTLKWDNRIENLRLVSRRGNQQNRLKQQGKSSRFIGVSWDKARQKWVARYRDNSGKTTTCGRFSDEIEAAKVAEHYQRLTKGEYFNEESSVASILNKENILSNIIALSIVSAMDVVEVMPSFTYKWAEENPVEFREILWQFGMDVDKGVETQTDVTHRTMLNRLVTCDRYCGNERTDKEWIESGCASRAAKDKASGSQMLLDIYRQKGLTE